MNGGPYRYTTKFRAELQRRYDAGENLVDIERDLGLGKGCLSYVWRRYGLRKRPRGQRPTRYTPSFCQELQQRYDQGESWCAIEQQLGLTKGALTYAWRRYGLRSRSMSEAANLRWQREKSPSAHSQCALNQQQDRLRHDTT